MKVETTTSGVDIHLDWADLLPDTMRLKEVFAALEDANDHRCWRCNGTWTKGTCPECER